MAAPKLDWTTDLKQPALNRLVASLTREITELRAPLDEPVLLQTGVGATVDDVIAALQAIGFARQE